MCLRRIGARRTLPAERTFEEKRRHGARTRPDRSAAADTRLHQVRDQGQAASRRPFATSARPSAFHPPRPCTPIWRRWRPRVSSAVTRASLARWRCSAAPTVRPGARGRSGTPSSSPWSAPWPLACRSSRPRTSSRRSRFPPSRARRRDVRAARQGRLDGRRGHPGRRLRRRAAAADRRQRRHRRGDARRGGHREALLPRARPHPAPAGERHHGADLRPRRHHLGKVVAVFRRV